ncbi:hypothetical protein [Brevundimonas sp. TWP2-3-4b1]|uniref:hypothetical protein n=1 Tax=Brevundimonas sp. TWP2-3-4b1 TaxID=2804580 RepID=UPI003CEE5565
MRRPRPTIPGVRTRGDWRGLVDLALSCAADGEAAEARGEPGGDIFMSANRRRMDLARRCGHATPEVLEREGGSVTGDVARALVRIGRAWSRPETPGETRAELTPLLKAVAGFLDARLHALATTDFQRAHLGRPEVA